MFIQTCHNHFKWLTVVIYLSIKLFFNNKVYIPFHHQDAINCVTTRTADTAVTQCCGETDVCIFKVCPPGGAVRFNETCKKSRFFHIVVSVDILTAFIFTIFYSSHFSFSFWKNIITYMIIVVISLHYWRTLISTNSAVILCIATEEIKTLVWTFYSVMVEQITLIIKCSNEEE